MNTLKKSKTYIILLIYTVISVFNPIDYFDNLSIFLIKKFNKRKTLLFSQADSTVFTLSSYFCSSAFAVICWNMICFCFASACFCYRNACFCWKNCYTKPPDTPPETPPKPPEELPEEPGERPDTPEEPGEDQDDQENEEEEEEEQDEQNDKTC